MPVTSLSPVQPPTQLACSVDLSWEWQLFALICVCNLQRTLVDKRQGTWTELVEIRYHPCTRQSVRYKATASVYGWLADNAVCCQDTRRLPLVVRLVLHAWVFRSRQIAVYTLAVSMVHASNWLQFICMRPLRWFAVYSRDAPDNRGFCFGSGRIGER